MVQNQALSRNGLAQIAHFKTGAGTHLSKKDKLKNRNSKLSKRELYSLKNRREVDLV